MNFNGKVVIITGASSGIGAGTAIAFAKLGADVVIVGRNGDNLKETEKHCHEANSNAKILSIIADVTKDSEKIIEKTIEKFGHLNVLVNNAGIPARGGLLDIDVEQLDEIMNTNVRAVFKLTKLAVPHLIATKGNIVNVSSVAGHRSFPGVLSYCMSKAALDQFTRCIALELAPEEVRVNSVNPGVIVTNIHKVLGLTDEDFAVYLENCKYTHPLGRYGEVREVADTIVFLASEGASFITGTCMPIDGGKHAMTPR